MRRRRMAALPPSTHLHRGADSAQMFFIPLFGTFGEADFSDRRARGSPSRDRLMKFDLFRNVLQRARWRLLGVWPVSDNYSGQVERSSRLTQQSCRSLVVAPSL
jgi:hypothetical protein